MQKTTSLPQIAIIGAGPAGLAAAEMLAGKLEGRAGISVYERKPSPARKFLMAGRGGLNITHGEDIGAFMERYGTAAAWLRPVIGDFTPQDLRDWCHGLGQETFIGSSGRVFPAAMKASPLLRAWRQRLDGLGVRLHVNHEWRGWDGAALLFTTPEGERRVRADAVLLALGGGSWAKLGSDGAWTALLAAKGVEIAPLQPANCGFTCAWSDYMREKFAGQPLKPLAVSFGDRRVQGEAVISAAGIEGGAIYALAAPIRDAIAARGAARIMLDLNPALDEKALAARLSRPRQGRSLGNTLRREAGLSPSAIALLHETGDITALDAAALAARIKAVPLTLTATAPIDRAISTAGGVRLDAVDEGLMLRALPGVFVAGEMLDWEAPTGGYLLQASFATGRRAAAGIMRYLTAREKG